MKIDFIDEDNIIVFLNKALTNNINFENKNELESYFKKLFISLKDNYNIKVSGFYDLNLYIDKNYGIIIEITKEEEEFYLNQVDMKLCLIDTIFLYELDEKLDFENTYYKYNDKYYLYLEDTNFYKLGNILEHAKIIYKDTDIIINKGEIK